MAVQGSLQDLLSHIQHARGAHGIVPGNPTSPPGLEAAPHGGHNAAQFYRQDAQGHEGYAAQLWMSRHPHAVRNGMIPGWVSQAMTGQISSALHQPLPTPSAPQTVGQPNMGFHHYDGGQPAGPPPPAIGGTPGGQPLIGIPGPIGEVPPPGEFQHPYGGGAISGGFPISGGPHLPHGSLIPSPGFSPHHAAQRALLGYT